MGALNLMDLIIIRNSQGVLVMSIPQTGTTQALDLDHLPKGIYTIEVYDEKGDKEIHQIRID